MSEARRGGRKRSRARSGSGDWAEARSPWKEEVTAPFSVDSVCGAWQAANTVSGLEPVFPEVSVPFSAGAVKSASQWERAVTFLSGAYSYRRTGDHFAGTCAHRRGCGGSRIG